jgi:intracellular sulfur oxidation DsrE/DsrF family protein
MKNNCLRRTLALAAVALLTAAPPFAAGAAEPTPSAEKQATHKVVFQMSDNDPAKWNLALNNAANTVKQLGQGAVSAEIVAFGPGINMLKFDSVVGERVHAAVAAGIRVIACQNTMAAMKLSREDMLGEIGYAPSGVVELIERQQQGYAYIRP